MTDTAPTVNPGNGGSRPVPDPTVLTDQAIARSEAGMRTLVGHEVDHVKELSKLQIEADQRFSASEVAHLREVDDIRFQAAERLAARESELNALALAAAFAAQKKASAKEAEYTRIASTKSETQFSDALGTLGELFATQTRGLGDKVDDLKDRVGRIENTGQGRVEQRAESKTDSRWLVGVAMAVPSFLVAVVAVVLLLVK